MRLEELKIGDKVKYKINGLVRDGIYKGRRVEDGRYHIDDSEYNVYYFLEYADLVFESEIFCECGKCKWSKNSNEIKSYKFDLRLYDVQVEREYFSGRARTKINGFCENDRVKFSFEGLPGKEWMDLTKTYTVEVREKE